VERFGAGSVVAGDLVLLQRHTGGEIGDDDNHGDGAAGSGDGAAPLARSFDERSTDRLAAVHVVSAEEAAAGVCRRICDQYTVSSAATRNAHESGPLHPASLPMPRPYRSRLTCFLQVHHCVIHRARAHIRGWRAGAYSIDDVVLPLPGGRVVYPQHETAQVHRPTGIRTVAAWGGDLVSAHSQYPHAC